MKTLFGFICLALVHLSVSAQELENESDYQQEIWRVTHIIKDPIILDSLVQRVHEHSGLLKSLDEEILMYDEEILQKKRNWVSSFRVGLNLISADTYTGYNNESVTDVGVLPNLGVTLAIDPEKFVNRKSYVRQATNKRQRIYHIQQDHKQRLKKEILGLYYDYLMMLEGIVLKEHTLNTRKQHLDVLEVEFRGGIATYDELLVVQNQYNLWEAEYSKSRIQALKKRSEIEVLLGF
ncbi:MAG: TolC family protein [Cyclobacteriaceae bacterium]